MKTSKQAECVRGRRRRGWVVGYVEEVVVVDGGGVVDKGGG